MLTLLIALFQKLLRAATRESVMFRRLRLRKFYPGLDIHQNAVIENKGGEFVYGTDCTICEGVRVIIEPDSRVVLGSGVILMNDAMIQTTNGGTIEIGDDTSIQERCQILGNVRIGRHVLFAANIHASSGRHYFDVQPHLLIRDQDALAVSDVELRKEFLGARLDIEDDCWLGINTVVLRNVRIRKGCIVGANSVVTKSTTPYTIVAGVPARTAHHRLRFEPPADIRWEDETVLPYFYEGFFVKAQERAEWSRHCGLAARSRFAVALSSEGKQSVCIAARRTGSVDGRADVSISHGTISQPLATSVDKSSVQEYRFTPQPDENGLLWFEVRGADARPEVASILIQRAWVE